MIIYRFEVFRQAQTCKGPFGNQNQYHHTLHHPPTGMAYTKILGHESTSRVSSASSSSPFGNTHPPVSPCLVDSTSSRGRFWGKLKHFCRWFKLDTWRPKKIGKSRKDCSNATPRPSGATADEEHDDNVQAAIIYCKKSMDLVDLTLLHFPCPQMRGACYLLTSKNFKWLQAA